MLNRELDKAVKSLFKQIRKLSHAVNTDKGQTVWLLRAMLLNGRGPGLNPGGFVLPTVVMVILVVILLTTAIVFRSFNRSKNASNVRVNEVVLNAATPALDRAKAKLDELFQDPTLPRATPQDIVLYTTLTNSSNIRKYTFGDETPLKLVYDIKSDGINPTTPAAIEDDDTSKTAWMFPVDTDNDGYFDSYTIYGIYFRSPTRNGNIFNRSRNPLEARNPPMIGGETSGVCADAVGTSASLVGNTSWFKIGTRLKKSFFVYTVNVPITSQASIANLPASVQAKARPYKGNRGFSALEYQQDRSQIPLVNNAVVYEDDLEITPGPALRLNGRIFTNSNLLTGGEGGVTLYQVSSNNSCFYEPDNGRIVVGGNLINGRYTDTSQKTGLSTKVHLYAGEGVAPNEASPPEVNNTSNRSVTDPPAEAAYNSQAFVERINLLVNAQLSLYPGVHPNSNDPLEARDDIEDKIENSTVTPDDELIARFRREALETYFKKRTRRVTYKEVLLVGGNALTPHALGDTDVLQGSASDNTLRAKTNEWLYPTDPSDGKTGSNYTKLTLNTSSDKIIPAATEPSQQIDVENHLGDRVLLGNNLPALWVKDNKLVGQGEDQTITSTTWDTGTGTRTRETRVEQLVDLGATDRDGFWETAAAKVPINLQEAVGGLRVITGAGLYMPSGYTTASTATDFNLAPKEVWSDMMPVASSTATDAVSSTATDDVKLFTNNPSALNLRTPYLRMRATAVYHYKNSGYNQTDPTPIACVSSYYDPTNSNTAKNKLDLPDVSLRDKNLAAPERDPNSLSIIATNPGYSNNGVVYGPPGASTATDAAVLDYQAQLKYPNGRWVNEPLQKALAKAVGDRNLADKSAIDAAVCALRILDGGGGIALSDDFIPHGAIMETAFLDARQVKAIAPDSTTTDYNLQIEQRQPLEIRATVLDLDLLRRKTIGGASSQEYLFPNSGIIYATRDDALLDLSAPLPATGTQAEKEATQKSQSPVDFKVDPTRRPNAIMLINGVSLARETNYRDVEKGLIMVSNLPTYVKAAADAILPANIKGAFNYHTKEEFLGPTYLLDDSWSNFYNSRPRNQLDPNYACRPNDPKLPNCTIGDNWRPASVLADAITLLSNNFKFGFRNDGDYDLSDNYSSTPNDTLVRPLGLFTNNYVTSSDWVDSTTSDGIPKDLDTVATDFQGSSYLNNFVTPVQRRVRAPEYVMELCPKLPVTACTASDWVVGYGSDITVKASALDGSSSSGDIIAGTTARLANTQYRRYPRRVAFVRNGSTLTLSGGKPFPLGITGTDITSPYTPGTVASVSYDTYTRPRLVNNALWFQTTTTAATPTANVSYNVELPLLYETGTATGTNQPRLVPVPQLQIPKGNDNTVGADEKISSGQNFNWMQQAEESTFNLVVGSGDTPGRPTEDNGGLQNFVRFIEHWNWNDTNTANAVKARISGAFIQFKRSAYATAPVQAIVGTVPQNYATNNGGGTQPFYYAPGRQWGYDVALLSQSPDLFAQKFAKTPDDLPDEFFREVGRDDPWVKTLLCAAYESGGTYKRVVDNDQLPSDCLGLSEYTR